MIFYVTHPKHAYTHGAVLLYYRPDLLEVFRHLSFDQARLLLDVPAGVVIWTDMDRMNEAERDSAASCADALAQDRPGLLQLNHPRRSLMRLDLLEALHAANINMFRAFRPDAVADDLRFPVFVRDEAGAAYDPPRLLNDRAQLQHELASPAVAAMVRPIVVEYAGQAGNDGYFRKYAAYRVGQRIFPQHCFASREWFVKNLAGRMSAAHVDELNAYVRHNPHAAELMPIFERAGMQYGRVDYTLCDGRLQVFEINTNPTVLVDPPTPFDSYDARPYADRHAEALLALPGASDRSSTPQIETAHQRTLATLRASYRRKRVRLVVRKAFRLGLRRAAR